MADIETAATYPLPKPTVSVYTKSSLTVATSWTGQPHLYCNGVTRRVNGLDEATLVYFPGTNIRQIGSATMGVSAPLNLRNQFVRVEFADSVLGDFLWTGYIVDEDTQRENESAQVFKAVGLEYFLGRNSVRESVVYNGKRIGRAVPFNDASGAGGLAVKSRGNRSTDLGTSGVYEFATSDNEKAEWTVKDIVQYLLKHFPPKTDIGAVTPCTWAVNLGSYLDNYTVAFNPDGLTVFEILNALLNPRRSLCWWLEYSEVSGAQGTATINIASLNQASVSLPGGGGTLPANIAQFSLNYDDDASVQPGLQLNILSRGSYKAVRTRGARITSTFSGAVGDAFETDWTSGNQAEYDAGASYTSGYDALTAEEQQARNDAWRRDERFWRVYATYRLPSNWDGKSNTEYVMPAGLTGGSMSASLTYHANWLRLLPRTLLSQGTDYESVEGIEKTSPDDTADDLLPPFGIALVSASPDKYQYLDKLGTADFAAGDKVSEDIRTAYAMGVQQDCPGVKLRASNGMNHMLALNHWSGAEPGTREPELDYDTLIFTVALECDHYAEAVFPESPSSGFYEELLIDVGSQYRLDYLTPGTVVRLDNGQLITTDGGIIRDDRPQLEDIARFAYEWYQSPKATLAVTWAQLRNWFGLGQMLTTVGDSGPTTLNTVIGEIAYDIQAQTTSIRTIGDQLNVREVI